MVNERIIRISDLFWYVLSKWKLLILAVVIGALLCGGYRYVSAGKQTASASSRTAKTAQTDGLAAYDHEAVMLFFRYLALAEEQMEYIRTAEFMQIDPYHADVSGASFFIRSEKADETDAVLAAYLPVLSGLEGEYGELFSYSLEKGFSGYSSADTQPEISVLDQKETDSGILTVKIFGADEASCTERIKAIEDRILAAAAEANSNGGSNTIVQVGKYTTNVYSPELLQLQKTAADTLYQMVNYMNNVQKAFSSDATDYVSDLTANGEIPDIAALVSDETQEDETEQEAAAPAKTSSSKAVKVLVKGAVLGGAALLILAVVLLCAYYILSKKLRFEDDIHGLFGIPCLGVAKDPSRKEKTGPDRAIEKRRYLIRGLKKETPDILAANIALAAKNSGWNTLYVTGTVFGEAEKQLAETLKELLGQKGIELKTGAPLLESAAQIEEMGETGNTVLIERASGSLRPNIAGKLAFCRESGVPVLGMIVLA